MRYSEHFTYAHNITTGALLISSESRHLQVASDFQTKSTEDCCIIGSRLLSFATLAQFHQTHLQAYMRRNIKYSKTRD